MNVKKVYEMAVDAYGDVRTLVRGLPYQCPDDWEEILNSLDEDSNLYLVKEPDNPKDELAIAAYLDDRRIGYVAASDNGKIWLYMTDDKMPCQFIERFEASFKIAFENPISLFENLPFEDIYRDKFGFSEQPFPKFEIPFLNNPKDSRYIWFDDETRIVDMEKGIPDFRRKLATRMIIIVGRKNSLGEYCYYIPYLNRPISDINDGIIQGLIDKYGFVIALPDVPRLTYQGLILMDLHVTYLDKTNYKYFDLANQSELVFSLTKDYNVRPQMASDHQTVASSDNKHNNSQDVAIDDDYMFMHDPQSTPSYSKSDYILKKGEVTISSIDKSTFFKIDKITSDLFSFVRQTLFPSTELFSYLKKHTPYYDQFYDFGQYETLIRIFVIKDLGRIYKGLNYSFNFDTAEGKPLFLYMDKEVGETTDISYDVFAQICDSNTQLEPAVKMRKLIEDFTISFYEYDIDLWTSTDFIIHSILKDVNNDWAKRYMELMCQFASAVIGRKERRLDSPVNSARDTLSAIDDFFPIFGFTLGKTTWKQAEDMGCEVEIWEDGPARTSKVDKFDIWDHDGIGVFTDMYGTHSWCDNDFPQLWMSKGFSWDISYDEWIDVFKKLGFNIKVTQQPCQGEWSGQITLKAAFEALSSDGLLLFRLNFDYGENGYHTSSPKTLYSINIQYKGSATVESTQLDSEVDEMLSPQETQSEESYEITDSPEGGKHVSMDVIIPEDGDKDFDFCSYECSISDKEQIAIIESYMKRFEQGKESRPFIMIGRPCLGLDNLDIFYSLDGEIIFNFIFDEKIRSWIREAGFVLGKVKSYNADKYLPDRLNITLSVSKRKGGEAMYKKASEEAMDYIEEVVSSTADYKVEGKVIDAVNNYLEGNTKSPYQVAVVPWNGLALYTTLDGEQIGFVLDSEILDLTKKNKGIVGHIAGLKYKSDGVSVEYTIRVSRSIPRLTMDASTASTEDSSHTFNEIFPLFGFTLGKTTLEQAESMGYEIKSRKDDPDKYTDVEGIRFYYDDIEEVFTSLLWNRNDVNFPFSWASKGFSWEHSYNEWMEVFRKLEYKITVKETPSQKEFNGRKTFSARFEALSPDGTLLFELDFNYGENGYYASSPGTLDGFFLTYDVTATDEDVPVCASKGYSPNYKSSNNSTEVSQPTVNDFFPLFGVTLGKTTWKQAERMGNKVEIWREGPGRYTDIGDVRFEDDKGEGVFTSLMWMQGDKFPPSWRKKGFSWKHSYDTWMAVFRNLGFKINVTEEPNQTELNGRKTLNARFEALSPDGSLLFDLDFGCGREGYFTSSPKTLDTIFVTYNRP